MIRAEIGPQLDVAVTALQRALGDDLVGVYLHGSAVLGCFGPHSDIDLVAVSQRALERAERSHLVGVLLSISAPYDPAGPPRPIELDLVLATSLDPWQYPATLDFHYSEEFRTRFEAREHVAWEGLGSRNLAAHITVLHDAGEAVAGPPVEEVFPDVPWADYVDALTHGWTDAMEHFTTVPRYGVLSIARIWSTVATGAPQSKASGAEWALPRLRADLRPVLEHGLAVYRGSADARWEDFPVGDYTAAVADEIDELTQR